MLVVECSDLGFILRVLAKLLKYLHYLIPIILIVLITFDLFKVVTGSADEKAKSEALNKAVKRLIYAVMVFLIPTVLMAVFRRIDSVTTNDDADGSASSWISCWIEYYDS